MLSSFGVDVVEDFKEYILRDHYCWWPLAPTTAEQRLARKNELKARCTLLMALPDKHQLKFNIHKDAKILMEAIEKRFGGNKETKKIDLEDQSLDDLFDSLKIYEAEVKSSSTASPTTQNITFVSSQNTDSTNKSVSVVASISATGTKVHVSTLPNVDTLSDAIIYSFFASQSNSPQLDNDDLKQIDDDDLEEMDLNWQMAMLTMRTKRFIQQTGRNLGANRTTSIGFDMPKVECYNCHMRGHFARECTSPKDTRRNVLVETQRRNVSVETSTSNALVSQCYDNQVFNISVFDCDEMFSSKSDVSMPASPVYDRYKSGEGYHVVPPPYIGTFMPPKPDLVFHDAPTVNETVFTTFNVELSPTKPDKDLSKSNRPLPLSLKTGFLTQKMTLRTVEHPIPADNLRKDIPKSRGHSNNRNRKECFVCKSLTHLIKDCDYYEKKMVQKPNRNHAMRGDHQHYARMTHLNPQRHVVPTSVLTRSKLVLITDARPVTTVVPHNNVTRPRPAKTVGTKPYSPPRRTINRRSSPKPSNFPQKVTTIKALQVNAVKGVNGTWDKGVIDSGCSRHMTRNMSYLSDFEERNGGYVAFGGNPKGDTECIVLSFDFKLPDENHMLLRVPR
uniref:CCHC-type domain-containing protein n=1 Tax=Tanacetum cinerariifolium TaxID=118510 RepID=A0A6L2KEV5_TANCI|nr:hypothetical protein [Tanacetum cinerariifolium]